MFLKLNLHWSHVQPHLHRDKTRWSVALVLFAHAFTSASRFTMRNSAMSDIFCLDHLWTSVSVGASDLIRVCFNLSYNSLVTRLRWASRRLCSNFFSASRPFFFSFSLRSRRPLLAPFSGELRSSAPESWPRFLGFPRFVWAELTVRTLTCAGIVLPRTPLDSCTTMMFWGCPSVTDSTRLE